MDPLESPKALESIWQHEPVMDHDDTPVTADHLKAQVLPILTPTPGRIRKSPAQRGITHTAPAGSRGGREDETPCIQSE